MTFPISDPSLISLALALEWLREPKKEPELQEETQTEDQEK